MILRYFPKGLKPSILTKLEYRDLKLEIFNQMVKKTFDTKAKAALQPHFSTKERDQNCSKDFQSANSIIAKRQDSFMKDFRVEKPKVRGLKSLSNP